MALKDIFKTQKRVVETSNGGSNSFEEIVSGGVVYTDPITYKALGSKDAGQFGGAPQALLPRLNAVYLQIANRIKKDERTQNDRKNVIKQEILGLEAKNATTKKDIDEEQGKLDHEEKKIEEIKQRINDIKENPKDVLDYSFDKASYWIGLVIIVLLTVYLFVFYSSASYSAFFKDYTPDDTTITQAVFDAQAIGKAFVAGFTELLFIIIIPVVFLGLGFLIHKFSEGKGSSKYYKIAGLVAVTFIFDFILAYEIVEKIYSVKAGESFKNMPDMTVSMAFQQVNFWMIIFAGFVVYIIWGFVFDFTMKEHAKKDRLQYVLKIEQGKLSESKAECKQIKERISTLKSDRINTQGTIDKLRLKLESYVIYFDDIKEDVNNYFAGWIGFLKSIETHDNHVNECTQIKNDFLIQLEQADFIKRTNDKNVNA